MCPSVQHILSLQRSEIIFLQLWIYFQSRLVYPILSKMIGMVQLQTHLNLSNRSSYRRCRKDEIVLCHALHSNIHLNHSYIS